MGIMNGDVTPNLTDHTDFGSVYHQSGMVTRVYKIKIQDQATLPLEPSVFPAVMPIVIFRDQFAFLNCCCW